MTLLLLLIIHSGINPPLAERADTSVAFGGGPLRCVIDTGEEMYSSTGLRAGFHYEMLLKFAEAEGLPITITRAKSGENYIDSIIVGTIDLLVMQTSDTLGSPYLRKSRKLDHYCSWYLRSDKTMEVKEINIWAGAILGKREYNELRSRFYSNYDPFKRLTKGTLSTRISPYDELIKKHAVTLGWDWRMLAAVIYQESRFSIMAHSSRGASGLMQILPRTAEYYGITDLFNPEQNIIAGTRHLARLQKAFPAEEFTHEERINFTLAAYNAGEGRITDCRDVAAANDLDSTKWEEIVKIIPYMRRYSIEENDTVRIGRFRGGETINYVTRVTEIYEAFCEIGIGG